MIWRYLVLLLVLVEIFAKPGGDLKLNELEEDEEEVLNPADYYLPLNVMPQKYKISLDIDTNLWNFHGREIVEVIIVNPTREIHFNARGLTIQWNEAILRHITDQGFTDYIPSNYTYSEETEIVVLSFDQEFLPDNYELHLSFIGIIRSDVFGLYRSEYTIDNQQKYVVVTQFQATYARTVFPCWDNTNYRSIFEIELNHPDRYEAYSNMRIANKTVLENNRIVTLFDPSPPMATYLVAFALAEYQTFRSSDDFIGVHVPSNVNETLAQYFITNIRNALNIFEDFLNRNYQLPKLDFISIPRMFFGGMEHWGLITALSRYFVNDPNTVLASPHQSMTTIITHELAHMWFGNEVTPESWNYLWLSEGMASYFELFIGDRMHSNWRLMDQYLLIHVHNAMRQDDKMNARPMTGSFYKPMDFNGQFDYIPYAKCMLKRLERVRNTGSVMRMIQHIIGIQRFRDFLFDYISARSFSTTNPDRFHERIQEVVDRASDIPLPSDTSMATIIRSWTDNAGYPVVLVTRTTNGISLTQKRFLVDWEHTTVVPSEFYIPVNTKTASNNHVVGTLPMSWIVPGSDLQIDNIALTDYVIVNRQQTGYYRVNYGDYDWKFLSEVLLDNSCHKSGNNGAIREMLGHCAENYWLNLFGNPKHLVTYQVASNLSVEGRNVISVCIICQPDRWINFFRDVVNFIFEIGNNSQEGVISSLTSFGQICRIINQLSSVQDMNTFKILRIVLFLTGRDDHEDILMRIIDGVGCSTNETIINNFLDTSIQHLPVQGSGIRGSDRNRIFRSVSTGSYMGTKLSLELILNNFLEVENRYESIDNAVRGISTFVVTDELLDLLQEIVDVHSARMSASLQAIFQNEITAAKRNVAWVNHFQPRINTWLEANVELPTGDSGHRLKAVSSIVLLLITFLLNRAF
uniref:Aminopeptidase n=1 Tax=Phlebotomus papatasi TaxID=29031 RepID=A0A1B0GNF5_PHLPP